MKLHAWTPESAAAADCREKHLKASLLLAEALSLYGVEGNGADVVSDVVPRRHQDCGLRSALMSSPEWRAG